MIRKSLILTFLFFNLSGVLANIVPIDQNRTLFLELEQHIKNGNKGLDLEAFSELSDYPLYPYLVHQWLGKSLLDKSAIKSLLNDFSGNQFVESIRKDWLEYLAKNLEWEEVIKAYKKTDDLQSQCNYLLALYHTEKKSAALRGIAEIWVSGQELPKTCHHAQKTLEQSGYLTDAMKWKRFESVLIQGHVKVAKQIMSLFAKQDRQVAIFWLKVHEKPKSVVNKKLWKNKNRNSALIFAYGIERLAKKNLNLAAKTWDQNKKKFNLTKLRIQEVEKALAIRMVVNRDPSAYDRLNQLIINDQEIRIWRVRAALLKNNWALVVSALDRLNNMEKIQPKWQYWRARAYWESGEKKIAKRIFSELAENRSFYGFVAADYVGQKYQFMDKKVKLPKFKLTNFVNNNEFKAVQEFKYFKREKEAREQWLSALNLLPEWQIPAAAFIAQEQGWDLLAAETIKIVGHKGASNLRFPLSYHSQIMMQARQRKIDPAIIFSLIRRESAFNKNAISRVGARGLMQIMPATGKFIAKNLKEQWQTVKMLFNPEINLRYGTYYYKRMLDRFKGNFALAAAAYNAGPHRVNRWLPKQQQLPADVWIEMIPFDETRNYVFSVLTNSIIYQHQLKRNSLKMKDLLKNVHIRKT